jgi:hypothetical protein
MKNNWQLGAEPCQLKYYSETAYCFFVRNNSKNDEKKKKKENENACSCGIPTTHRVRQTL